MLHTLPVGGYRVNLYEVLSRFVSRRLMAKAGVVKSGIGTDEKTCDLERDFHVMI